VASHAYLRKLAALELDSALSTLRELLDEEDYPQVHENLYRTQHDAVGRGDEDFKIKVLAGAYARLFAAQQKQIDELREALQSKRAALKA
jgi:hypothetical protein